MTPNQNRLFSPVVAAFVAGACILASLSPVSAAPVDPWWKHAVVYEIYPRSFQDSKGNGIGDLNGITARLDYLQTLGVDALWIAPMYPSPQVDFGYDVSDYENVDPQYGTLADFDRLVAEAKKRDIRIVLDMVVNHTSDKHRWFIESSRSRTDPRHDWYCWSDGRPGSDGAPVPPNNWVSLFGGSAWQWMPSIGQFYYHKFYRQQPDLNWRNPAVEKAMFDSMRFWLDRGVAGFRLDAVPELFEDEKLRDEPVEGGRNAQGDLNLKHTYTNSLPEVHGVLRRMREMVEQYPGERVLIGETYLPSTAEMDKWYGGERHDELQLPMDMLVGFINRLDAGAFRQRLLEVQTQIHGSQPLLVFDNHDNVRSWDRYGDGVHDLKIAKVVATLLLASRSTALMYQGEELGQTTTTPTRVEDVRDPIGVTGWPKEKGRDGERTPMQWDDSNPQAGFSTNPRTWLPVPASYATVNAKAELADPNSILNWYRQLIALRRSNSALHDGRMGFLDQGNANVLTFVRIDDSGKAVLVSLNMTGVPQTVSLNPSDAGAKGSHVTTLMTSDASLGSVSSTQGIELPAFATWIASIE
jgi:alpha-glucosidase